MGDELCSVSNGQHIGAAAWSKRERSLLWSDLSGRRCSAHSIAVDEADDWGGGKEENKKSFRHHRIAENDVKFEV